jgi:hypothetical protein
MRTWGQLLLARGPTAPAAGRDLLADTTIIVPLAPGEPAWPPLSRDLAELPAGAEVIFACPRAPIGQVAPLPGDQLRLAWLRTRRGRARQMNAAARAARRRYLWFLHADSRFTPGLLDALRRSVAASPKGLHYFDLAFAADGPLLMPLNAAGVRLRSRYLRMPFGDQGFFIRREVFDRLGGFDEEAPYGEDHLFVWKARRAGVPLHCTGVPLITSARVYADRGWLATTAQRLYLTYKQALPELVNLWMGEV